MAELQIRTSEILSNIDILNQYLGAHGLSWTLVAKVLGGDRQVLEVLLGSDVITGVHSVADARISGLRSIKQIRPELRTLYLKPPPVRIAEQVVRYADISLNSSRKTIHALNEAARRAGKVHQVIVMVEMGELREGIIRDRLLDFYSSIFELPHIEVAGIGANLGCMYGIEPNYDKLIQLSLFKELIEARFGQSLPLISGSSSISLPLIEQNRLPQGINHLRIGEAAFFGTSPLDGNRFRGLSTETFTFSAQVIERAKKDSTPSGIIGKASIGSTAVPNDSGPNVPSERCIVDFGILDVDVSDLAPLDPGVRFAGVTSDMTVYNLDSGATDYQVGDRLHFKPNYMAVARLMHSKYVNKEIVTGGQVQLPAGDGVPRAVEVLPSSHQT